MKPLPKKLIEKRDGLSFKSVPFVYDNTLVELEPVARRQLYRDGFNQACEILLPEIEKLITSLKIISVPSVKPWDDTITMKVNAEQALKQWKQFIDGNT